MTCCLPPEPDVLQIESGGLLRNNVAGSTTIGDTTNRGVLTAGVTASTSTELVIYNAQNTVTINSVIKDTKDTFVGGTGTVTLIKSGAGGMTLTAANLYTGRHHRQPRHAHPERDYSW